MADSPTMRERFLGCILGHAVGDGLGAPFEGLPSDYILASFGRPSEIVARPPVDIFYCTDDTHMSLAVAEVLCGEGGLDEERLIQAFARVYDPKRGYGQGMRKLLEAVSFGEDWRKVAETLFGGGSYGNGGAMLVAPVGLLFHEDLDRVWDEAGRSARVTHRHPLGVEGAQLFATAVAIVVRGEKQDLFGLLWDRAKEDEYRWLLSTASKLGPHDGLAMLGSGLEAHRSVVTAITCFAVSPESYESAVARALALGNDTDTLMAMTGALAGAHLGVKAVPGHLVERLENGRLGRDDIVAMAEQLFERYSKR